MMTPDADAVRNGDVVRCLFLGGRIGRHARIANSSPTGTMLFDSVTLTEKPPEPGSLQE